MLVKMLAAVNDRHQQRMTEKNYGADMNEEALGSGATLSKGIKPHTF